MMKANVGGVTPLRASLRLTDGIQAGWSVWEVDRSYLPLEKVSRGGSSYVCTRACTAVDPLVDVGDGVEGQYWLLIAKRGDNGKIRIEDLDEEQKAELKGEPGKDGTVNGVNALTIQGGDGIEAAMSGSTLTIKAKNVEEWTFTVEGEDGVDTTVTKKVVLV